MKSHRTEKSMWCIALFIVLIVLYFASELVSSFRRAVGLYEKDTDAVRHRSGGPVCTACAEQPGYEYKDGEVMVGAAELPTTNAVADKVFA